MKPCMYMHDSIMGVIDLKQPYCADFMFYITLDIETQTKGNLVFTTTKLTHTHTLSNICKYMCSNKINRKQDRK